jgi:hypothetical protein
MIYPVWDHAQLDLLMDQGAEKTDQGDGKIAGLMRRDANS